MNERLLISSHSIRRCRAPNDTHFDANLTFSTIPQMLELSLLTRNLLYRKEDLLSNVHGRYCELL